MAKVFPLFMRKAAAEQEAEVYREPDVAVPIQMLDPEVAAIGQAVMILRPLDGNVRDRVLKYLNERFIYAPQEPEPQQLETDDDGLVPPTRQGEYKLED